MEGKGLEVGRLMESHSACEEEVPGDAPQYRGMKRGCHIGRGF